MNLPSMRFRRSFLMGLLLAGALNGAQAQQAAEEASSVSSAVADAPAMDRIAVAPRVDAEQPTPKRAAASDDVVHLEEIVVTATKRATPVRNIPATVNVLSGEDLERQGVQSIDQIVAQVPGVNLTDEGTGGTAKRITIRGISTSTGVNPTAGTLYGDMPFSDPFIPKVQLDPNPFDMATVEVLKGPQGTLFGGTGLNGLIRYVPEAPNLDEYQLKYYTQLTSYPGNGDNGWSYGAVVNAPFADNTAALRLMGFHRDIPGYVDDTQNDKRDVNGGVQYGFRASLAWAPDENWKVSLMGAAQKTHEDDLAFTDNYDGQLQHGNAPRASPSDSRYMLGNLNIQRSFGWGDLISQTGYVDKQYETFLEASRAVGGQLPLLAGADDNRSKGFTQELRAVSAPGDGPWRWLVGAFYYDLDLYDCAEVGAAQSLPTLPPLPALEGLIATPCNGNAGRLAGTLDIAQLVGDINLKEQALFGELTREFGDYWEATLGARGYRLQSGGTVSTAGLIYTSSNQGRPTSRDADSGEHGISPKASIVFKPTRDLRTYFTASRGFRFGGPQIAASTPTTSVPPTYQSDSLWNYELGVRSDWLDQTLRIDASAYHIDWKHPQVSQISQDGLVGYIDNVGAAKADGVELSLRYLPPFAPGLSLDTAVSWNKTVTTEAFTAGSGTVVESGSPWPLAPRWQTSTTLAYALPVYSWQVGSSLRHTYLGQACNTIDCTAQVFGFRTLDLNLYTNPPAGSYWPQLSVSMNNLTDERGYSNITTNPAIAGDTVTYIAPRMLVFRLSGNF